MPAHHKTFLKIALFGLLLLPLLTSCASVKQTNEATSMAHTYTQDVRAPEFPAGLDWLNSESPLQMSNLRGKVLLLDFWTYCCINCIHVIPKLHDLEARYGDSLVVIGVHSAKFEEEGDTDNIRQAILRYDIGHPVANDREFKVWREYAVKAWPTMVLIDPDGYIVATKSGENAPETFDPIIGQLIADYSRKGKLDTTPLALKLEKDSVPPSLLSFPGKVLVDEAGGRLFISDSGHNRIVVTDIQSGEVLAVIGNGQRGMVDGDYAQASFNDPQGLALEGSTLYVADTKNHVIRAVDLEAKTMRRVAGTGEQGGYGRGAGDALTTRLASPWDLEFVNGRLYIAMAGPHQIWYYDPATDRVDVWAGSGRENLIDGARLLSALAQPSGLSSDGEKRLFFADSEVSAIRAVELSEDGGVMTIVGQGLFDFGDVDGGRTEARLQHPLGVVWHDGVLYVADTYNNKIKRVIPEKYSSVTFAGSGDEGHADGALSDATFDEPGGLDVTLDGTLYVADTNNNLIRRIDTESGTVSTVVLRGLEPMDTPVFEQKVPEAVELPVASLSTNGKIMIQLDFPAGYKLNKEGGLRVTVHQANGSIQTPGLEFSSKSVPYELPFTASVGNGSLTFSVQYFYCREDNEGLCYLGNATLKQPLEISETGGNALVTLEAMKP